MRINNIHITNYKGFKERKFEFPSNFTLLHGANATGKSTVLDAVAIALDTFLLEFNEVDIKVLKESEIRRVVFPHSIELQLPVNIKSTLIIDGESFTAERILHSLSWFIPTHYPSSKGFLSLADGYAQAIRDEERSNNIILPLLAYYGTGRLNTDILEKKYEKRSSRLDGYDGCLDSKANNQRFFNWFKTLEDNALKFNKDESLYQAFTQAITTIVEDWKEIKFSWELDDIIGLTENGEYRAFENLSDGYKTMVTLAADLAYRCIKLNPHLQEKAVTETSGVVLIDELDMHLHPKWQRNIVAQLKAAFPKVQFIATSHSPYIIQSLEAEELISLDGKILDRDPKEQSLEFTTAYMGVSSYRSAEFEEKERNAQEVYQKIERARKQNGKEQELTLEEIDKLIEKYSNDPAYVAELKFKKMAKLGKE